MKKVLRQVNESRKTDRRQNYLLWSQVFQAFCHLCWKFPQLKIVYERMLQLKKLLFLCFRRDKKGGHGDFEFTQKVFQTTICCIFHNHCKRPYKINNRIINHRWTNFWAKNIYIQTHREKIMHTIFCHPGETVFNRGKHCPGKKDWWQILKCHKILKLNV